MYKATPTALLVSKLRRLKICLRDWNVQHFRNIYVEIEHATADLNNVQNMIATTGDTNDLFDPEMNCLTRLNDLIARRHTFLTQKNRLQWLKDGDWNSSFFHRLHGYRSSRASISTIQVDNAFITVDEDIGAHAADYYEKLFKLDPLLSSDYSILDSFNWSTVSYDQNLLLTAAPRMKRSKMLSLA